MLRKVKQSWSTTRVHYKMAKNSTLLVTREGHSRQKLVLVKLSEVNSYICVHLCYLLFSYSVRLGWDEGFMRVLAYDI